MLIEPPIFEPRRRRFPFDRIGVLALTWSALFILAAAGLALLLC